MLNNEASREALKKAKRIVIKVGTSTITYANGKRNFSQIDRLAREISDLQNQGKEMILVTSGAVAVGVDRMGLPGKPKTIPGKQAAAAVGQGVLMHTYEKFFADYGQIVAQVLITKTEAIDRHRYTNTRNTFMELMRQRVIPIVNENDVVALDELKNVMGKKKALTAITEQVVKFCKPELNDFILVEHGDDIAGAEQLADKIRAALPGAEIKFCNVGYLVGAHAGPGALAVFFVGAERPRFINVPIPGLKTAK